MDTGVTLFTLATPGNLFVLLMYVSFIGLRLTKTRLTLINRIQLKTKFNLTVTLKPKLTSLLILSSFERLSEL